ncbi:MAG: MarR family winged helix-turn-helix transcriptional regulator [Rhodoglobus sp.]
MTREAGDEMHDGLRISVMRLARRMRLERVVGDVSDGQLSALFVIFKHGPQTLSSLSEHDRVTPPSMNRTVNALVERGLVERSGSPDDGRKVLIDLTDAGRSVVTQTRDRRAAWFSHQLDVLTADELATLDAASGILRKLADS